MRFYINEVCIEIQYSFLLVIALTSVLNGYDYLLLLIFSALHELGHLLALYICKGTADKITFAYYGIGLKHKTKLSPMKEFIFLIFGLLVNLVFVIFNFYSQTNLALLIINVLPIYPLDGGRILKLILNFVFRLNVSDYVYKIISSIVILLLICLVIYFKNLSFLLIIFYLIVYAINNSID